MYTGKQVYSFRGKTTLMGGRILEQSNLERALHGPVAVKDKNKFLHVLLEQFKQLSAEFLFFLRTSQPVSATDSPIVPVNSSHKE